MESYEIINGKKILSPSSTVSHNNVLMRLAFPILDYLVQTNEGRINSDNVDVYLPDGNLFKPDLVVIRHDNKTITERQNVIRGVPDMVVEILSRSTMKNDLTLKKDIYEKNGVAEYWIVDPFAQVVTVYVLREGKFALAGEYINYDSHDLSLMSEEEKADAKFEIPVNIFPGLNVGLKDIFAWL